MKPRPDDFLPLTEVAFEILLALAEGERHGYAIMREVEERTAGRTSLHPGTLYRALGSLVDSGLIGELDERPDPAPRGAGAGDERRRYYRLTDLGRRVAAAEAERLQDQLSTARARRLLPQRRTG